MAVLSALPALPDRQRPLRFGLTLLVGAVGGAIFQFFGAPLAWLLGAMVR